MEGRIIVAHKFTGGVTKNKFIDIYTSPQVKGLFLKEIVASNLAIPVETQTLTIDGRVIQDGDTLAYVINGRDYPIFHVNSDFILYRKIKIVVKKRDGTNITSEEIITDDRLVDSLVTDRSIEDINYYLINGNGRTQLQPGDHLGRYGIMEGDTIEAVHSTGRIMRPIHFKTLGHPWLDTLLEADIDESLSNSAIKIAGMMHVPQVKLVVEGKEIDLSRTYRDYELNKYKVIAIPA